jgi:citrate/tricarballylate utilization protein
MIGGIMLCLGTVGLIVLKAVSLRDTETRDLEDRAMVEADLSLLTLLLAISLTGLITLALRSTNYDGLVLTIHLALVASLFLTAPYSKLTHLIHRYLALVRDAIEEIEESTRYMKITRIPLRSSH